MPFAAGTAIKPKAKCCRDKPRCKRCPVVCKKLMRQGFAEKVEGRYVLTVAVPKKHLKAARG
jgi:hypothetical protein